MMKRFLAMLLTLAIMAGTVSTALAATPDGAPAAAAEALEGYYGSRLTDPAAIAFYQALETMDFASDSNLSVEDPAVVKLADTYASGSDALIRSFGAAVDSFRYDHTEYFYVDWDMLSVKVGRKNGQYVVSIGTGRTDTYLRDKTANIAEQVSTFNTELDALVAEVQGKLDANATNKEIAKAANDAVAAKVTYDFCDDPVTGEATEESKYIRTAYGALVNGKAVCEGYARLYKAVLNKLGVECELISGYYIDGEAFEPHMWTYVQDKDGKWYGVDPTMSDGHRLQTGGIETAFNQYFWQTYEIFAVDHFEDGAVSSVQYEMPYPELYHFWDTPTSSGKFKSGYGAYGDKQGFWFSYDGKSAAQLKEEGLYLAFRIATTNTGEVLWSPWQTAEEMIRLYQSGGVVSDNGKTYLLMPNIAMSALEAGIFDIPEDKENKTESGVVVAKLYSEEAATTHLIEKIIVENPTHDPDYIAPTHVRTTEPWNLLQAWLDTTKGTQHISVTYGDPLRVVEGKELELAWGVSSYNTRDLSLEAVKKNNAKVENVQFDGDRTISFDFTPSRAYNHNMISYDFTVKNMVNIIAGGKDGVPPASFSIGCRYDDDIACCKIFNDGRLYVNSYAQPSIAMNGDLSTTGWKYTDTDGTEKSVSESQRSQMALVVTVPNDSAEMTDAAEKLVGTPAAVTKSKTYEIDLNICGKITRIPDGSYMKLNLGVPDEFAGLTGDENIKFKLYHFKRNADGSLNYDDPEEIECVLTPYGIIAEVNSFSPYVLVAVDNSKLPEEKKDVSKGVALAFNGHGGKVTGANAIETLTQTGNASVTYTLVPDEGYEVEYVRLNGSAVKVVDNKITLTYDALQSSNTLEVGFVAASVKKAEADAGIENVTHGIACTVTFDSKGGSEIDPVEVASGAVVAEPEAPVKPGYTFEGWYMDLESDEAYDFSTPVVASITLHAKWKKADWENPFTDVAQKDWYYSAVQFAAENGLFYGTSTTAFSPNSEMTRGMLATVLYRLAKEPEVAAGDLFSDVAAGKYYTEAIAWAADNKIVNGYGNNRFGPEDPITREQIATILWRYADSPESTGALDAFTDKNKISSYAVPALQWAVEEKIVNGKGNGILDPGGKATRAEVATMLMRYCGTAQ